MIWHAKIVFRKNKVSSELESNSTFYVLKVLFQLFASQLSLKKKSYKAFGGGKHEMSHLDRYVSKRLRSRLEKNCTFLNGLSFLWFGCCVYLLLRHCKSMKSSINFRVNRISGERLILRKLMILHQSLLQMMYLMCDYTHFKRNRSDETDAHLRRMCELWNNKGSLEVRTQTLFHLENILCFRCTKLVSKDHSRAEANKNTETLLRKFERNARQF